MTTTPKVLIEAKFAEAAQTAQYPASTKASIDKFTATNKGAANETLTINLIPPAGAVDPSNAISKVIAPGATWQCPEIVGHLMETGGTISTLASTAGKIWIRASGREFT